MDDFEYACRGTEPLFQELPEGIGPDWTHGFLIGGMIAYDELEVARAYRRAGDALAESAMKDADLSHEWVYPVFFVYRHALELYLKLLVKPQQRSHSLPQLITAFEAICRDQLKQELPDWAKQRLAEICDIDPRSTSFRYSDVLNANDKAIQGEWWVEFPHLKWLMNCFFDAFEKVHFMNPRSA